MTRFKYIILRLLLVTIPVLMAMVPTMAQSIVYTGQTTTLSLVDIPGDTYTWELYNNVTGVNFAVVPGNCPVSEAFFAGGINSGPAVNVTWVKPGIYFYTVKAVRAGCTMNLKVGKITILQASPIATILQPAPICKGDMAALTISFTGTAPWNLDLSDGTTTTNYSNITANPFTINVSPTETTAYTVLNISDAIGTNNTPSNTVTVTVNPKPGSSRIYKYDP